MDTVGISCEISCARPGLHLRAAVGDLVLFDGDPNTGGKCHIDLPDTDDQHQLTFCLSQKTAAHTTIDADGNIVDDLVVEIRDLCFDEIPLAQIFVEHAVYEHDFNGTRQPITDRFYGTMGCNGTVSLKFSTPIYLWLLEHM